MFVENDSLWERMAPLIAQAAKPSRYVGCEWGAIMASDKPDADYHAVMIYPDIYEIGQANQAVAILYTALNSDPHIYCERAYLPWIDLGAAMRAEGLPLASIESFTPLRAFDFVGITLPHELCATNVLEVLDLANIALYAAERCEDDPLVFGGGPLAYNPEPLAPFFDAIFIGEGEQVDLEAARLHRKLRNEGACRADILRALAALDGVYVPTLFDVDIVSDSCGLPYTVARPAHAAAREVVVKRVIADFDATDALPHQIVSYSELIHDRLSIEVLRGCARGCRFCQAGMIYRPVRERSADTIVNAVARGMACTGYDEVSLTSLSTTDHSNIASLLRRLNRRFAGTGNNISIPSQRVDAFDVKLARLLAAEKKGGITLAVEAGTQRLRDVINKGVTEEQLFAAVTSAFEAGWRRLKLYFMIGLPHESDEDVTSIGDLCKRVYRAAVESVPKDQRSNVRMSVSVALFVPKPMTPFQWDGQISFEQIEHRIKVLKDSFPNKGIDLHWHDSAASYVEAALARGGRECAELVERAWRHGARFDAWTELFDYDAWKLAAKECALSIEALACRRFDEKAPLPWGHISAGIRTEFLLRERAKAAVAETTPDCSFGICSNCGVCMDLDVSNRTENKRVSTQGQVRDA